MSPDWSMHRLGDIAITQSGGTPSRSNNSFFNGEIPWVKSGELNDSTIYASEEKISTEAIQSSSAKVFEPNTLLLAMYGATVGKTGILKIRAATNQAVCAIRPKENNFNIEFLKFYLIFIRPQLLRERYGGAQPNISQTLIQDLKIPLPLLTEQKNIAALLFKIQQAIEIQESIIERIRELKKSTMHHVFTHGLRGERLKETEVGQIPESWEVTNIGTYCQKPEYGFTESAIADEIGPKFLRITDITENGVNWDTVPYCRCPQDVFPKYELKENDILFARIGATTGKSYIVKDPQHSVFASYLIRLRPLNDVVPDYLYYFFNSNKYWNQVKANKNNNLKGGVSSSILAEMLFPLPLKKEQQEIALILKTIDQGIELHTSKKSALQDLFKTMLNKLMTGEIRVKDLDVDVSEVSA